MTLCVYILMFRKQIKNFFHKLFISNNFALERSLIPAIIPTSKENLTETLERLSFADEMQIDVVDGEFVPFVSWPYEPEGQVGEVSEMLQKYFVEVDLMVIRAVSAGREWQAAGAKRLIFHLEGLTQHEAETALSLKDDNCEIGFAINNDTDLSLLVSYINKLDFVQLMGIKEIGSQGQPFDERVLERIKTLRKSFPHLIISVDGAVSMETAGKLIAAGANRLVSGSAILKADEPKEAYKKISEILN